MVTEIPRIYLAFVAKLVPGPLKIKFNLKASKKITDIFNYTVTTNEIKAEVY